ncbi:MAG: outer membrane beta-barrel protein [Candidatus Eisenbacteria bacterium]|nr:outer membrane beta-barrel protein [Candidatus Eisenbacteria bacterium]
MVFRIACVTLVSILMAGAAMAQPSSVSFGLKGGINMARVHNEYSTVDPAPYFLPMGGITLGTHMNPNIGFDLDLLFVRKGVKEEHDSDPEQAVTVRIRADYAVVSPMLRISPGKSGAGVYFLGGGELGYLIQSELTNTLPDSEQSYDYTDAWARWDYGITFGMGFQSAATGQSSFFLESRYALGLADTSSIEDNEFKVTTRGVYFLGGLRF